MSNNTPQRGFAAWFTGITGMSLATAIILLSERGPSVLETLRALPLLLDTWTKQSPIGAWTLLASLLIPALLTIKLDGWLPHMSNEHTRATLIDLTGVGFAVWIAYMLMPGLPGLLIGAGCAALVSTLALWLRAVFALMERQRKRLDPDPPPPVFKP